MADYLEAYAARFELPVRTGVRVERLSKDGERFVVSAGGVDSRPTTSSSRSGAHQRRARSRVGRASSTQASCSCTRASTGAPAQLREGGVLVVGAGNSGAEIAKELAASHVRPGWPDGTVGEIPVPHGSRRARLVLPIMLASSATAF